MNRRPLRTLIGTLLAAALIAAGPAASRAATKSPIDIGVAVALTGFLAANDGPFVDGLQLAAKRINAAGGMDGHEVRLHVVDDASNATTGVTAVNQLLNQYNVSVVIGGLSSAQAAAIEPILARAQVPQFVYSELPPDPQWAFICNIPHQKHVDLQLNFAKHFLHAKSIAIVYSQTPYGQIGARVMEAEAKQLGLNVVVSTGVEGSVTDMTPVMSRVKDAAPDAVIDILTGATHIVETKAAATVGLKAPLVMVGDDIPTLQKAAASYSDLYFTATPPQAYPHVPDARMRAQIRTFMAAYRAAGLDPANVLGAAFGWDALAILQTAVKASGATGGEKLRGALEHTTVQGTNTLYRYLPDDHTGQKFVPNPLQMAKLSGSSLAVVYALK